jgi:hypothetical protein
MLKNRDLKIDAFLDNGRFLSGRPIHAQVPHACCQNRLKKSADLQRTQAELTLCVVPTHAKLKGYSGMPNHALNFDGGLQQHFANKRNRFYIESPLVCKTVAIKRSILKI